MDFFDAEMYIYVHELFFINSGTGLYNLCCKIRLNYEANDRYQLVVI